MIKMNILQQLKKNKIEKKNDIKKPFKNFKEKEKINTRII